MGQVVGVVLGRCCGNGGTDRYRDAPSKLLSDDAQARQQLPPNALPRQSSSRRSSFNEAIASLAEEVAKVGDNVPVNRSHSWPMCIFMSMGLSLCITVDILQYSMPLAFLPSVLEDRGHSPMKIVTAIGVYYWTGFVGGLIITLYQVYRLVWHKDSEEKTTSVKTCRRHLKFLIVGLLVGTLTLAAQTMHPHLYVHTVSRFVQGFAGSFIFFYTFLLSVSLFENSKELGAQQVFAMTAASCALNVAEVLGSFLGAVLFDMWGQRSVFFFLGAASVVNQAILLAILFCISPAGRSSVLTPLSAPLDEFHPQQVEKLSPRACCNSRRSGWLKLNSLLRSPRVACAVLLIVIAAMVKGSVEEMLPFHADHQWGYDPLHIGELFFTVASAYIVAAIATGWLWKYLDTYRVAFSAFWLAMLGACSWAVFDVATIYKRENVFFVALAVYGACLGLTHTPAALLLADAVDQEDGSSKDTVNGIWNTMWEAGGSIGFFLPGLLADEYKEQMSLLSVYAVICILAAAAFLAIATPLQPHKDFLPDDMEVGRTTDLKLVSHPLPGSYGST